MSTKLQLYRETLGLCRKKLLLIKWRMTFLPPSSHSPKRR